MLELRYRFTQPPGVPYAFAPWFEDAPDARVHGVDVAWDGEEMDVHFVAHPGEAPPDVLERNLAHFPFPTATLWEPLPAREGVLARRGRWREPYLPGVPSPMVIAFEVLGPELHCSFTVLRNAVVHRNLVPDGDRDTMTLWRRLRDGLERYARLIGAPVSFELERLARFRPFGALDYGEVSRVLAAAAELGYYDEEPRASLQEVAVAAGVTQREALEVLRTAERHALGDGDGS